MRHLLVLALALAASAALAPPAARAVTLDFDHWADPDEPIPGPREARSGIIYDYQNYAIAGNLSPFIILGDGSYTNSITFGAPSGSVFTPRRFDLVYSVQAVELVTDEGAEPFVHENLVLRGLRGGEVVAEASVNADTIGGRYRFSSAFAGIDALFMSTRFFGADDGTVFATEPPPGAEGLTFFCDDAGRFSCGEVAFDDLQLVLDPAPAPVPLPAGGALLAGGLLAGLAPLGWRARRGRRAAG